MFTLHIPRSPSENTINLKTSRRPVKNTLITEIWTLCYALDDVTANLIQRAPTVALLFDLGEM